MKRLAALLTSCLVYSVSFVASGPALADSRSDSTEYSIQLADKENPKVVFNTKSKIYHVASCNAAKQCTHCIEITLKEARRLGGAPCKSCGAGEQTGR